MFSIKNVKFCWLSLLLLGCHISNSFAQLVEYEISLEEKGRDGYFYSSPISIFKDKEGLRSFAVESSMVGKLEYKKAERSHWQPVLRAHGESTINDGAWLSTLIFTESDEIQFRCIHPNFLIIHSYEVDGTIEKDESEKRQQYCNCDSVSYLSRADWCPDGSCPRHPNPELQDVSFLIIHHSGSDFESEDYSAVVRSYYYYHTQSRGWDDIGYNYLIDPEGVVYEGRGSGVKGAHFCGANGNTEGICMIGNFNDRLPSEKSLDALQNLNQYLSCHYSIHLDQLKFHEGSEEFLMGMSAHRDGCPTECPGETFYPTISEIRNETARSIQDTCIIDSIYLEIQLHNGLEWLNWTDPYPNEKGFYLYGIQDNEGCILLDSLENSARQTEIRETYESVDSFFIQAIFDHHLGPQSNKVSRLVSNISHIQPKEDEIKLIYNSIGQVIYHFAQNPKNYFIKEGLYFVLYQSGRTEIIYEN